MWKQQKNFEICSGTLILLYLCFAFEVKAQEKAKYIGVGIYVGPHTTNFMSGKGFETTYWYDYFYKQTYYEQAKRRLKYHLQSEFYFTYNNRVDLYWGYYSKGVKPYPFENLNINAQIAAQNLLNHDFGIRYHKHFGKLRLSIMTGYSNREYVEMFEFGIPGNITKIPRYSMFKFNNHGIHCGVMMSISPTNYLDVSIRYQYHYFFITDADNLQIKNGAQYAMPWIDKSNQVFFDTHRPNYQHSMLSVGLSLRYNRLLNLNRIKLFKNNKK